MRFVRLFAFSFLVSILMGWLIATGELSSLNAYTKARREIKVPPPTDDRGLLEIMDLEKNSGPLTDKGTILERLRFYVDEVRKLRKIAPFYHLIDLRNDMLRMRTVAEDRTHHDWCDMLLGRIDEMYLEQDKINLITSNVGMLEEEIRSVTPVTLKRSADKGAFGQYSGEWTTSSEHIWDKVFDNVDDRLKFMKIELEQAQRDLVSQANAIILILDGPVPFVPGDYYDGMVIRLRPNKRPCFLE